MNALLFILALGNAPSFMAETRKADPRMQCELIRFEEWQGQQWVLVGFCERSIGTSASWRETYFQANFAALGLAEVVAL